MGAGKTQVEVSAREAVTSTPRKLALRLLALFFSPEELSNGICTPQPEGSSASCRNLLNQDIVDGIRCKSYFKFMLHPQEVHLGRGSYQCLTNLHYWMFQCCTGASNCHWDVEYCLVVEH